jgi:hypothetical protein
MKRLALLVATITLLAAFRLDAASLIPLNDLYQHPYDYGYFGGLWDDGSNSIPPDHLAAGLRIAKSVQPLDANGRPSPDGKIVFLSVGFQETARIFCSDASWGDCEPHSFVSLAKSDARINKQIVFANAAAPGLEAHYWWPATSLNYGRINDQVLAPAGVTDKQVQVAWMQMMTERPYLPLPIQFANAYGLKIDWSESLQALKLRYPNLRIVYLSSRVYGGYSTSNWNPEPFAYENAFTVRWLLVGQIQFMRDQFYWDSRIAKLDYDAGTAPWISWGPYLWANGTTPRSDGLTWQREDFAPNGESLSEQGAAKGATQLFNFLMNEPTARPWFTTAPFTSLKPRVVRK